MGESRYAGQLCYELRGSGPVAEGCPTTAEMHLVVTGRGRFDASLRHIKLDDGLWMQHGQFSLPAVLHSKMSPNRRTFFLQFDADQAPILHSGTDVAPNEIISTRSNLNIATPQPRVMLGGMR